MSTSTRCAHSFTVVEPTPREVDRASACVRSQLGAEIARMAFSADLQQGAPGTDSGSGGGEGGGAAAELAEARRENRVLKQKMEQKERELEHALGLRRKLGDATRKIGELRATLEQRDLELRELHSADGSIGGGASAMQRGGMDALAMEEMMRELEQTRARATAAEAAQRKAQARVASLTKVLEETRQRNGSGWAAPAADGSSTGLSASSSPPVWARAALQLQEPDREGRGEELEPEPESEPERQSGRGDGELPAALIELRRRLEAGELNPEEAKVVRMRLVNHRLEHERKVAAATDTLSPQHQRDHQRSDAGRRRAAGTDAAMSSLSPAKMTAGWTMDVGGSEQQESGSSADGGGSHSGGVPNPEQLMQRRRQQEQRQQQQQQRQQQQQQVGGQASDDPERQRQQQREQQAAIVRSWGRSKEGEAARQKIKDAAHDHRIGWLKSGQVMQKVRKRLLCAILSTKNHILPRQARDKHGKS
jgi:hypothetical protein